MGNDVLDLGAPVERAVAERALAERLDQATREARALIDAALTVMARGGNTRPAVRDVVRVSGLSNQAFYRHFPSRDALLLAVLARGQELLIATLDRHMAAAATPAGKLAAWIRALMAQAQDPQAARLTRPFSLEASRIAGLFPDETAVMQRRQRAPLEPIVAELGGDPAHDAVFVQELVMARMRSALNANVLADDAEVERLVAFCLTAIQGASPDGA